MKINGIDITTLSLTPLAGTNNALLKPYPMKKMVVTNNESINGVVGFVENRKADKRDVTLLFHLKATSADELYQKVTDIQTMLLDGENGSGVNAVELEEPHVTFFLVFDGMTKYDSLGSTRCTLSIKFVELNPLNRQ